MHALGRSAVRALASCRPFASSACRSLTSQSQPARANLTVSVPRFSWTQKRTESQEAPVRAVDENSSEFRQESSNLEKNHNEEQHQGTSSVTGAIASGVSQVAENARSLYWRKDARNPEETERVPNSTVYVGNLEFRVTKEDLEDLFAESGDIKQIMMARDSNGNSRGFALIEFHDVETASKVIDAWNNRSFRHRKLFVKYHAPKGRASFREQMKQLPPSRTLFVQNISFAAKDEELRTLFGPPLENMIDVRVAVDRRTGQLRGFAHAEFTDLKSAKDAMDILSGKDFVGRPLRVAYAESRRGESKLKETADEEMAPMS